MTKVIHVTTAHPVKDVRIFWKQCRTLANAGYEVVFVVPHDGNEKVDGVKIHAIPRASGRLARFTKTLYNAYRAAVAEDGQVYHLHDPDLVGVALLLRLKGKLVIYDFHENLELDVISKDWIPERLRSVAKMSARLIKLLITFSCNKLVAATSGIAGALPPLNTVTIHNYPVLHELDIFPRKAYAERTSLVAYTGGITAIRAAREIVTAMSLLPEDLAAELLLVGSVMPPGLTDELSRLPGWDRVRLVEWLPREPLMELLLQARVGLAVYWPLPNHLEAEPNKIFEYMLCGLPMVVSDFPLWRHLVSGPGRGLVVNPTNPESIAEALEWLLRHPVEAEAMGQRGRDAALSTYNWEREATKLLDLYGDVTALPAGIPNGRQRGRNGRANPNP